MTLFLIAVHGVGWAVVQDFVDRVPEVACCAVVCIVDCVRDELC